MESVSFECLQLSLGNTYTLDTYSFSRVGREVLLDVNGDVLVPISVMFRILPVLREESTDANKDDISCERLRQFLVVHRCSISSKPRRENVTNLNRDDSFRSSPPIYLHV